MGDYTQILMLIHGIIGVHRPPPKILGPPPPQIYAPPLNTKALGPPLIYLVGPLAISDPNVNICVGPPNSRLD